ncbi:aldo/keto reductase [Gulosibacter chungangensis]|uniref:aldo/keto reductase n=1 Tax=Gulosibacter chungangensis TaxID=979746 RepID=UPI001CE4A08C|nr:aldo/keto reductase [Gulosibacter chungangensis]
MAFGTAPLGGVFGDVDEHEVTKVLDEAFDSGINLLDTSPYYGLAEERLGRWLTPHKRERITIATKAGRYGVDDFDFSPERIRQSLEQSLRLLNTDYVDILHLHDIEFSNLDWIFEDSLSMLHTLRDEGKCRFIGMTGYPIHTMRRVIEQTDVDAILTYAKDTLLDDSLSTLLAPIAAERQVGLMNAAAVSLGLLTPGGTQLPFDHPAPTAVRHAAARMIEIAQAAGENIAFIANQYAIQRTKAATTVVGTAKINHLRQAIQAASTPINEPLLEQLLAQRPDPKDRPWPIGKEENR